MLDKINSAFKIEFVDYERDGTGVVVSSGCGIGMGLMDVLTECRYFIDLDTYRTSLIDWEAVAVCVSVRRPSKIVMAGWFTIDRPLAFDRFIRGVVDVPLFVYRGGVDVSLSEFVTCVKDFKNLNSI